MPKDQREVKILYIEDSASEIDLLDLKLRMSGLAFVLDTASDKSQAFSKLQGDYDVVITDYKLGFITGDQIVLKSLGYFRFRPVIVISGVLGDERAVELIRKGAADFVLKENLEKLSSVILRSIREAKEHQQSVRFERELKEQKAILDAVFHSSEDFIFLKDTSGKFQKVNLAMARHFDISEKNFVGRSEESLQDKENYELAREMDSKVLETGKSFRYESELVSDEGERMVLETLKTPVVNEEGIVGLVAVSRNITQRRAIQEALQRNKITLEQGEVITHSGSFQYDEELDIISGSVNFRKMLALHPRQKQLSLPRFCDQIHPADRALFVSEISQAIKDKKLFEIEFRIIPFRRKVERYWKIQIAPDLSNDAKNIFVGTVVDITLEREHELALVNIQEEERKHVSRELHDGLGQKLGTAKMYLGALLEANPEDNTLSKVYQLLSETLVEVRNLSRSHSVKLVEENGLNVAIEELISTLPQNIDYRFDSSLEDQMLDDFVGGNIFRIIQEAATNTLKYAEASTFEIQLNQERDILQLTLKDDGKGMVIDPYKITGNGMKNIIQRTKRCNGLIKIDSKPKLGTTFDIKVPMK